MSECIAARASGWTLQGAGRLSKAFEFEDFRSALAFVNRVGEIADTLDHHPKVELTYGRVILTLWTHTTGGLTDRDERLAEAIDRITLRSKA